MDSVETFNQVLLASSTYGVTRPLFWLLQSQERIRKSMGLRTKLFMSSVAASQHSRHLSLTVNTWLIFMKLTQATCHR